MTITLKEKVAIRTDPQKYSEYLGYINAGFHKKIYAVLADETIKRILFIVPPGHGKFRSKDEFNVMRFNLNACANRFLLYELEVLRPKVVVTVGGTGGTYSGRQDQCT